MHSATIYTLLWLATAAIVLAQAPAYQRPLNADCIALNSGATSDAALFPSDFVMGDGIDNGANKTQVTSARGFTVDYYNTYKVVTNTIANETYVLYQCGTTAPKSAAALPAGAKVFQIPLTSLSAPETVPYAFVELLGLDDRVHDVSTYVTSPCGQKILACGRPGPDPNVDLSNATMLQATVGPYVDGVLATSAIPFPPAFAFSSAQDPGPLNRAEWIKFLGLFFNRERAASDTFAAVAKAYNDTKAAATAAAAASGKKPVVAFASHFVYAPDEYYQLSFAPYKVQLAADAGGAMLDFAAVNATAGVTVDTFSNTTLDFAWNGTQAGFKTKADAQAAFFKALRAADIVIDETFAADPTKYDFAAFQKEYGLDVAPQAETAALPWLAAKRVYREDGLLSPNLGLDWFEGAIARPDQVLADVARALGTSATQKFTWIRNIQEDPVVQGPESCTRLTSCSAAPAPICPFVSICRDGTPVLLQTSTAQNAACSYAACPGTTFGTPTNTAQMAAPAVIVLTVLIVFVEALINFC